jgi:hypothetical protein
MRKDILARRDEIERWIASHRPKAFICRELRCKPLTLDSYLGKMGLTYLGNMGGRGRSCPTRKRAEVFLFNGSLIKSHLLKLKLIEDGLQERRCENCRGTEWLGKSMPLELHRINGDRFDNRFENLQLLCPNCHALTDNHSGKGRKRLVASAF